MTRRVKAANGESTPELKNVPREFHKMIDFDNWQSPSPDEMQEFIQEHGLMNGAIEGTDQ